MINNRGTLAATAPIVFFDGVCNLCNGAVNWLLDHDPGQRLRFAPLQGRHGQELLAREGMNAGELSTILVQDGDRVYRRSAAVLHVTRVLPYPWRLGHLLLVLPRPLRDTAYLFVASRRYRWFGKREACRMPTPELRRRFLE